MSVWLGRVCREAREQRAVKRVHIAAKLDVNEQTIGRFEAGRPARDPDLVVAAYGAVLDIDPRELWLDAARRYLEDGERPTLNGLLDE
jgi:DNA-binding XRE family transcriptional regulator